jgi:hypothetical protein
LPIIVILLLGRKPDDLGGGSTCRKVRAVAVQQRDGFELHRAQAGATSARLHADDFVQPACVRRGIRAIDTTPTRRTGIVAAADAARAAAACAPLWLFISLLFGAFAASLFGTFGGRQRDA